MGTVRNARVNQGGPKCAGIVGLGLIGGSFAGLVEVYHEIIAGCVCLGYSLRKTHGFQSTLGSETTPQNNRLCDRSRQHTVAGMAIGRIQA